ncbi:hypothetical protein DFH28DRAFT_446326 [Melampsora americana]|nr:hypothetical protein DFH28DRAFT_446326 [Melampsora americana]
MSPRTATGSSAPSPVRLSVLSGSILQSLLELSRLNDLSVTANPGTRSKVIQNINKFRSGLIYYRDTQDDEIIEELRRQYDRIIKLASGVNGLEEALQELDLSLPGPSKMTDDQTGDPQSEEEGEEELTDMSHSAREQQPLFDGSQSLSIDIHDIPKPSTRLTSRKTIEEDQKMMRNQNQDVQMMQQAVLDDQDRSLDALANAISRQRDLSLHISSELEVQEGLLSDLDENMDFTSNRLRKANRKMNGLFDKMARDGACWTIFGLVVVLLILIIILK